MHNHAMALSFYEKALSFFRRKNDSKGIGNCLSNIAVINAEQGNNKEAIKSLLEAQEIQEKSGNNKDLALTLLNIGLNYKQMKEFQTAIQYLNQSRQLMSKNGNKYDECFLLLNLGQVMLDVKKPEQAREYLYSGEKLAREIDAKDLIAKSYEFLSDYNAAVHNYNQAYFFLNKSKQLNDSILNAETTEKVNQLQYQYEITKREVEKENLVKQNLKKELQLSRQNLMMYILIGVIILILLLVAFLSIQNRIKRKANQELEERNDLINAQKNELVKLNASKDKFLSILAHDIKNPLSSIFSISEMLLADFETLKDDEFNVFIKDINTLANNLFEIINTLLSWGMSQNGFSEFSPQSFPITNICSKTVNTLQTVAKQKEIVLVNQADEDVNVLADENMILTVLHNLVNNAIKFSYIGTKIYIEAKKVGDFAEITVIDSGIGLSPENKSKLFRYDQHFFSRGTAGEKGTGLGLILCKDFIEKNGGSISVESEVNKGSTFVFTLPLAQ